MSLSSDTKEKFDQIAKIIAIELSGKLSSVINRSVNISYTGFVDSCMNGKTISVKKDSFLVSTQIETENLGPISLIATNQQVVVIADLFMGGEGNAGDDVKPDETNEMVFGETINTVTDSVIQRLCSFKEGLEIKLGSRETRPLKSIKEATLSLPSGVEDSVGLGFKIKISGRLDSSVHLELNSKAVEFIVNAIDDEVSRLDEERFALQVQQEYASAIIAPDESEEVQKAPEVVVDEGSYKINEKRNLGLLRDISLELIVELGRSQMKMKDVLRLTKGSAIELDKACSQPVDLYVHNRLVASGEVVAIDDNFGLRITSVSGNVNLARDLGLKV